MNLDSNVFLRSALRLCVPASFVPGRVLILKCFQRLLGLMAAATVLCQIGLLCMRPLQIWLQLYVPCSAWHSGQMHDCRKTLAPWLNTVMYEWGVSMGRVISRKVIITDASLTGWGAVRDGSLACGTWTSAQKKWHINGLELKAVFLALQHFLPVIKHCHVLIRTQRWCHTSIIKGVFAHTRFKAWCSISFFGRTETSCLCGQCMLQTVRTAAGPVHGEWSLHPQRIQLIWSLFGQAEIDLFISENAHCHLANKCPPGRGHTLESLAPGVQICYSSNKTHLCADGGAAMAQPDMVSGINGASNSSSVAEPIAERSVISGQGFGVAPQTGALELACLAGQRRASTRCISASLGYNQVKKSPFKQVLIFSEMGRGVCFMV